ncbi:unnamed protein product, partial [Brassica oleracea]
MVISDMKLSNCHKRREYNLNTPKPELHTAVKVKDLHTAVEGCTMARGESSGGFGGSSGELRRRQQTRQRTAVDLEEAWTGTEKEQLPSKPWTSRGDSSKRVRVDGR